MKILKTLFFTAVGAAVVFAANQASAAPQPTECLFVKSLSAKLTVTTNYSMLYSNDVAKPIKKSMSLKQVMQIVDNACEKSTGSAPPSDAKLAWNPYGSGYMFLTNSAGYYWRVAVGGTNYLYAYAYVEDIATQFKLKSNGGNENDTIVFYLDIYGYDLNGDYFEIYQDYGTGTLKLNGGKNGMGNMTINSKGGGYGALMDSDDGVCTGSITLQGKLTVQGAEPYSLWWW